MPYRFDIEFDDDKAASNALKHGVTFEYGIRAFSDPRRVVFDASRSEDDERRLKLVGVIDGRVFTLVYTMRGKTVRIISVSVRKRYFPDYYLSSRRKTGPTHPQLCWWKNGSRLSTG